MIDIREALEKGISWCPVCKGKGTYFVRFPKKRDVSCGRCALLRQALAALDSGDWVAVDGGRLEEYTGAMEDLLAKVNAVLEYGLHSRHGKEHIESLAKALFEKWTDKDDVLAYLRRKEESGKA